MKKEGSDLGTLATELSLTGHINSVKDFAICVSIKKWETNPLFLKKRYPA
mgnify:CR=1 FL=1